MQVHVRDILARQNPGWEDYNPDLVFQPSDHDEQYEGTATRPYHVEETEPYRPIAGLVGWIMWMVALVLMVGLVGFFMSLPFIVVWQYILS